jgi:hypothetical protein
MRKVLARLAVLALVFGVIALTTMANAAYLFPPTPNGAG